MDSFGKEGLLEPPQYAAEFVHVPRRSEMTTGGGTDGLELRPEALRMQGLGPNGNESQQPLSDGDDEMWRHEGYLVSELQRVDARAKMKLTPFRDKAISLLYAAGFTFMSYPVVQVLLVPFLMAHFGFTAALAAFLATPVIAIIAGASLFFVGRRLMKRVYETLHRIHARTAVSVARDRAFNAIIPVPIRRRKKNSR